MFRYNPEEPAKEEVMRYIDYVIQTVENHISLTDEDRDRLVDDLQKLRGHVDNIETRAAELAK